MGTWNKILLPHGGLRPYHRFPGSNVIPQDLFIQIIQLKPNPSPSPSDPWSGYHQSNLKNKTHSGIPYSQTHSKEVHWKGNENSSGSNEWSWTNWKSAGSSSWNKDNSYSQEEHGTKALPDHGPEIIHWSQNYQQQSRGSQHWNSANIPIQRRNSRFDCSEMRDSRPDTLNYNTAENRSRSLQRDNKDHSRPYVKQNIGQKQSNYPASIPQQGKQWTVPQPL